MGKRRSSAIAFLLVVAFALLLVCARAGSFSGNSVVYADDPNATWNPNTAALTVSCWFKLSIPSDTILTDDMVILVNQNGYAPEKPFSYLIRYSFSSGNIEFVTQGGSGTFSAPVPLITRPFVERWYHVAVERAKGSFVFYVDGRIVAPPNVVIDVGDSGNSGFTVGGWGAGRYLFGEVQEFAVYKATYGQSFITDNMFQDQRSNPGLAAYYKLGFSTNSADNLKNFAPSATTLSANTNGKPTFDQTDEAGEQSAFDSRKNGGRDALMPLSGAFSWQQTALARPTPGIAFDFTFGYSSANSFSGFALGANDASVGSRMSPGWRHTFDTRLVPAHAFDPSGSFSTVGLMKWDGSIITWDQDPNTVEYTTRSHEYYGELVSTNNAQQFQWTTPERLVYVYRNPNQFPHAMDGRLLQIHDFNGNSVQLTYDQSIGILTQVVDSVSGVYNFSYSPQTLLTNLSYAGWSVSFTYDSSNRLSSKTLVGPPVYSSVNTTWQFLYNSTNNLLDRIVDPRGITNLFVAYDQYGRQTNQWDALGRSTTAHYGSPNPRQITRVDPATNSWIETYDRKGHILSQTDPLTNSTSYTYDTNGNRTSITEPLGWKTLFGYDNRANVIAKTNALGEITTWVFHSFFNKAVQQITPQPSNVNGQPTWTNFYAYDGAGNLTNHSDALGALVSYTYSTNGLVLTSTDANGSVSTFTYDSNGFLIARTDPATNTTSYVVNEVGWKRVEIDALGRHIAYSYDINGNVVLTVDPIFREFTKTYDANGNLLTSSDAMKNVTRYAYDAANQRTNTTDRTGTNTWLTFYTLRGKLERATDPLGNTITNTYDAANRLIRVMDPLGNSVTNQYDANGHLTVLFDKLGQRWSKTYDRLNRAIAETDPLGNTRTTTYDVAGSILQTTTPNGFPTLHAYDGRGRLTKWHDAEGFDWLYDYDGNANITNITDALDGHYVMAYGLRNERTLERNQDNLEWQYTYDELLRLTTQTDPNKLTRTVTYDTAGRIRIVDFSSGRQDTYDYDPNNNLKALTRRAADVSTTSGFNYDILDRVTQVTDPFYQTINYRYDALSRVTLLLYPDGKTLQQSYDALNRLTNQIDWAGRQMTYVYDQADRLIRRTYPNGVVQTNAFDNAGRITALSYSASTTNLNSINLALTYAYDRNGNKTGGGERGTFAWPLPSLSDETSHFTAAGRITKRVDALNPTNSLTYTFDPSGNMTNASGGGQNWALVYDEDNRTTSMLWQSLAMTNKLITNRYDALGRRVSRTLNGVETRYVLDLHGNMERILCDTDARGNITAWYVHGPDLSYRVDAANNTVYYHADAMANVISLTGTDGTNLAQYAYTPYGRSLGSNNVQLSAASPQPFLFVGSQGVMEELPGLYFMRARYYSAEAGAFLSTDPVKKIGPGWKPQAYTYANDHPTGRYDPNGNTVLVIAGAGNVQAAGGLAGQAQLTVGTAIDPISGDSVGISCVSAGSGIGVSAGASASADIELYLTKSLNDMAGTFSYAGVDIGAGGRGSADVIMDESGLIGGSIQFGLYGGGGATIHSGLGTCLVIPGTAGNVYNPFLGPDHSLDANGGTVAGSTPMMARMQPQPAQQKSPYFQLNAVGSGGGTGGSMANSTASIAAPYCSAVNAGTATKAGSSTGPSGTTSSGGMCTASSSSSNSGPGSNATSTQTTNSSTSLVSQVTSVIANAVAQVGKYLSSWFGGGRP